MLFSIIRPTHVGTHLHMTTCGNIQAPSHIHKFLEKKIAKAFHLVFTSSNLLRMF